ncbi:MAG TPA: hypothetical protein VM238_11240 [Phycisphaerae bacterium]|nr:hypothetical protein [Phycisphaerae bacterium]
MHLVILAEQAAAPGPIKEAEKEVGGVVEFILANPFALALTFVFLVALIGAFVAARKRDRCLRKFKNHHVTLVEQAGRRIWGLLKVFSKGLELVYESPFEEPSKNSFLIYETELARILAIYRFVDRLDETGRRRRERQARKLADPPLPTRIARWARNIVNTFRDAIVSAMGMSVQQAAKASPSPALQTQGGQINAIGSMLVGETANAYEPMIEQYIGRPVILEVVNPADPDKRVVEYHGYLGEYSAQFVLLVDVRDRFHETVPLGGAGTFLEGALEVRAEKDAVRVENRSAVQVVVEGVRAGGVCHDTDTRIEPGERGEVAVPPEVAEAEGAVVAVSWEREFDLIVPRSVGVIRHASEMPRHSN